jgi:hypothetical protein
MPPENFFFLALVVFAFGGLALALAYGSAVAGGTEKDAQSSQNSTKVKRA